MTPRLRHLPALNRILLFEFPNEALSSTVLSVCVDASVCFSSLLITALLFLFVTTTYIFMLITQKCLWLLRLWLQRRDALRLASTQLGPMLCCNLKENAQQVKGQVWRRANRINCVEASDNTHQSYKDASWYAKKNVQCLFKAKQNHTMNNDFKKIYWKTVENIH